MEIKPIESVEESGEIAQALCKAIFQGAILRKMPIEAIITGLLTNMVAPIPDNAWEHILEGAKTPCCNKGCNCHELGGNLFMALDDLRNDWYKSRARKNGGRMT